MTDAITGSNGKTTTTLWVYHILKKAGFDVGLAGNIGASYAKQVAQNDCEWFVLELSSFQLDDMHQFKADIAIMTNISPDHLDRYNYEMENMWPLSLESYKIWTRAVTSFLMRTTRK